MYQPPATGAFLSGKRLSNSMKYYNFFNVCLKKLKFELEIFTQKLFVDKRET